MAGSLFLGQESARLALASKQNFTESCCSCLVDGLGGLLNGIDSDRLEMWLEALSWQGVTRPKGLCHVFPTISSQRQTHLD